MASVYVVTRGHPGGVMVHNRIPPKPVPPIANTPLPG
jgi:hypothetical protein